MRERAPATKLLVVAVMAAIAGGPASPKAYANRERDENPIHSQGPR
jgi:hypothetical protein